EIVSLAVGGALGTLSRYAVSGWAYRLLGERLAYGTLVVNVAGCFLLAFIMQVGLTTDALPRTLRLAVTVGFLGAFTTFSTFGYETMRYLEDGAWLLAAANAGANLFIGLAACWAGLAVANVITGGA
ncbi:MAG: fluoride efflux transporter CrcB, partial [Deltaproteobacteria bacterium]